MAQAIVAQPVRPSARPVDRDLLALAEEIAEDEGLGMPVALVLATLYRDGLTDYAQAWDHMAAEQQRQARATCPVCGAAIVIRQYHIGGRGYQFFEVCGGDGSHYGKRAA